VEEELLEEPEQGKGTGDQSEMSEAQLSKKNFEMPLDDLEQTTVMRAQFIHTYIYVYTALGNDNYASNFTFSRCLVVALQTTSISRQSP
jgi:hypothetical protein